MVGAPENVHMDSKISLFLCKYEQMYMIPKKIKSYLMINFLKKYKKNKIMLLPGWEW